MSHLSIDKPLVTSLYLFATILLLYLFECYIIIYMKRRYKVLIITIAAFVFLFIVLPYLVPISHETSTKSTQALVSPSGKFISVNDINMYVEEFGSDTGETIVLLQISNDK